MVTAYGPERVRDYKNLIGAMEVAQANGGQKTGSMFIQLKQPGAVLQLSGAALAGLGMIKDETDVTATVAGAAIVLSPPLLAKLMTNPTTAKWIIQGITIPRGTKEAVALASRILPIAYPRMATSIAEAPKEPSRTGLPSLIPQPMGQQQ